MQSKLWKTLFLACLFLAVITNCNACSVDSDCGSVDAPGVCVGGFCQCGVGFVGNVPIDPISCSLACAPPAVPDSVAFLNEPTVTLGASAGNLELSFIQDSFLKQNPTSVAFLNPSNGSSCPVLSNLIGNGVWTQGVEIAGCDQTYSFSRNFASEISQACWIELPSSTETGSQYAVDFRNFQTQLEVVQTGEAPFGQSASRASTLITREFRRNYTLSVATQFRPNSAPFEVEATGRVQYRLVLIDYDLLNDKIVVQVETRVADTAKLLSASINDGSTGLSALVSPVALGDCAAGSPAGFCQQFATVEFSADPCNVNAAELRLNVQFACADGSDPTTCGYTGLPAGNIFILPNNIITYDACPVVVTYGLDVTNSWLRLHEDVARSTIISSAPLQESTIYGRVQLAADGDAVFASATVTELHIWQVASPANIDLGDQKTAAFLTLALDTSTASQPTIDFDLTIEPSFFDIANQYYMEAYVDVVFANTGPLTRKLRMMIPMPAKKMETGLKRSWSNTRKSAALHNELVYLSRDRAAAQEAQQNKGVFSATFKIKQADKAEAPAEGSSQLGIIIGAAVGGACLVAAVAVIAVVLVKRRKNKEDEAEDTTSSSDSVIV